MTARSSAISCCKRGQLTVRMAVSRNIGTDGDLEDIQAAIRKVAEHPLVKPDNMLRIVGIKTFLDGGMLTGSAYMREPWGVSQIYAIQDPSYRGVLFIPREKLLPIVETTLDAGLQFTAHSVGDGAVHTLMDVYEELNRKPKTDPRPSPLSYPLQLHEPRSDRKSRRARRRARYPARLALARRQDAIGPFWQRSPPLLPAAARRSSPQARSPAAAPTTCNRSAPFAR